jgi:hypothetical protein
MDDFHFKKAQKRSIKFNTAYFFCMAAHSGKIRGVPSR